MKVFAIRMMAAPAFYLTEGGTDARFSKNVRPRIFHSLRYAREAIKLWRKGSMSINDRDQLVQSCDPSREHLGVTIVEYQLLPTYYHEDIPHASQV